MPIAFDKAVGAAKTATGGSTLAVNLSSTAGAQILVGVSMISSTGSVTSITDAGGNVYQRIATGSPAAGILVEVWATNTVGAAASGSVTITFNATGFRAGAIAISHLRVAFAGNPVVQNTGNTSPTTTGSITLKETNSWIISFFVQDVANAWTQQNGVVRQQQAIGTTLQGRSLMVDSNDNASPITNSATYTGTSNWITFSIEYRLLEPTQLDTMSMADALGAGYGNQIADDNSGNLTDSLSGIGYGNLISDSMNNWQDLLQLPAGGGALTLVLTDSGSANWLDALGIGYGNLISDQVVMRDGSATIGGQFQLDIVCPHLNNWTDALSTFIGGGALALVLTDDGSTNWQDALGIGYGNQLQESLALQDALGLGYGNLISDSGGQTDALGLGYGNLVADSLNLWSDLVAPVLGLLMALSDQDTTWQDALGIGYGNVVSDRMTMSDFLGAGYGAATSDQMVMVDSLGAGYGGLFSDNLNNWQDTLSKVFGFALSLSDQDVSWQDALGIGYGLNVFGDQMQQLDFMTAGYGAGISDQLIMVDSLGAGYGGALSDSMNFWQDLVQTFLAGAALQLQLSDALNWQDALGLGYGNQVADQNALADALGIGYGMLLSDQDTSWADALTRVLGLLESFSDQLSMADAMFAGYGMATSDQLVIVDSLGAGYGALLSDTLNNWQDVLALFLAGSALQLQLSDALNWQDALGLGYGNQIADQNALADALGIGYGIALADQVNWLDLLGITVGLNKQLADQMQMADFMQAGYGMVMSDQLVLVDSIGAGYGALLSDSLNNWQDAIAEQLISPGLILLQLTDALQMSDLWGLGYGMQVGDVVGMADALGVTQGMNVALTDSLNNWLDALQTFLFGGAYQLIFAEDLNNWQDALQFVFSGFGPAQIFQVDVQPAVLMARMDVLVAITVQTIDVISQQVAQGDAVEQVKVQTVDVVPTITVQTIKGA